MEGERRPLLGKMPPQRTTEELLSSKDAKVMKRRCPGPPPGGGAASRNHRHDPDLTSPPPSLDKRVHGVDRRRRLRALVALVRVLLLLAAVLADEGSVLVELSVPALPVVHQAVVALVTPDRPVGGGPAAFQRLVVLRVTVGGLKGKVEQGMM